MKNRLAKLIDVKTIVTISMLWVFCYLAVVGKVTPEQFYGVFIMIIAFYFGTQTAKGTPLKEE